MAATQKNGDGSYHVLDFQNLNDKGLAGLVTALKQAGAEIAEVIPAGPARKKDGVAMKQFSLVDMAGQIMAFNVIESGDVSGVTLNGKVFPETHPTSLKDFAGKIAAGFEKTEQSFMASLARKVAKQARIDTDNEQKKNNKTAVKTQGQRLVEATEKLKSAQNALKDLNDTVTTRQAAQSDILKQLAEVRSQLQIEVTTTSRLKYQIKALQGAA